MGYNITYMSLQKDGSHACDTGFWQSKLQRDVFRTMYLGLCRICRCSVTRRVESELSFLVLR